MPLMASPPTTYIQTIGPLGSALATYDRNISPKAQVSITQSSIPRTFIDAMSIREAVFVQEQSVPLENELDDQDASSVHIVLYTDKSQPIATIRILPLDDRLPVALHKHRKIDGSVYNGATLSAIHKESEQFITLGRLAVLKEHRRRGYADVLVRATLDHSRKTTNTDKWSGLVMIHAQKQVQRFWARCGFVLDEDLGIWDEEGIDHVAMFMRL